MKNIDLSKTEFWISILGMLGMIATAVLEAEIIAQSSVAWVIMGIVATAGTYIGGRSAVKRAKVLKRLPEKPSDESASIRTEVPAGS